MLGSLTVAAGLLASATFSMGKDLCRFVAGVAASDTSVAFQLWALLTLKFTMFNQLPISEWWIHVYIKKRSGCGCSHARWELVFFFFWGGGGCFSFGGTVQYIEESNIYLCFVV